jgi:hypothetical protein
MAGIRRANGYDQQVVVDAQVAAVIVVVIRVAAVVVVIQVVEVDVVDAVSSIASRLCLSYFTNFTPSTQVDVAGAAVEEALQCMALFD